MSFFSRDIRKCLDYKSRYSMCVSAHTKRATVSYKGSVFSGSLLMCRNCRVIPFSNLARRFRSSSLHFNYLSSSIQNPRKWNLRRYHWKKDRSCPRLVITSRRAWRKSRIAWPEITNKMAANSISYAHNELI